MSVTVAVAPKKKPIPVHSPKVRLFLDAAVQNAVKSRSSTIAACMDYRKENAEPYHQVQPKTADGRGAAMAERMRNTQMDKVLNPAKEKYIEPPAPNHCPSQAAQYNRDKMNRSSINSFPVTYSDCPAPRNCPTSEGLSNQEKGWGSQMNNLMRHDPTVYSQTYPARGVASAEADSIRQRNNGSVMASCLDTTLKYSEHPPQPRCPDRLAKEQLERSRGCMDKLFAGELRGDPPPRPRITSSQAGENASKEGQGMLSTMAGGPQLDSQPPPRVKREASRNFEQGKGTLTSMQYNYNKLPPDDAPHPRVKREAEEFANASKGTITKNLFYKYGNLPGDIKPKPHVPPRARKIAIQSRGGAMKDLISPSKPYKRRRRAKSAGY